MEKNCLLLSILLLTTLLEVSSQQVFASPIKKGEIEPGEK